MTPLCYKALSLTGTLPRFVYAILLWSVMTAAASAHASLNTTEPRDGSVVSMAPRVIALTFSEPVSPTSLKLMRPDRSTLTLKNFVLKDRTVEITPPGDLSDGSYLFSWRVVSEDGHPIGGSVVFSIGRPNADAGRTVVDIDWPVRTGLWIGKVALYVGLFFGVGGAFAVHWFADGSGNALRQVLATLGIGFAGALLSAGFQGLDTVGETVSRLFAPAVWKAGMTTSFGPTVIFAIVALALAGLALASGRGRDARWISISALITAAFALCLSGHASAADPQWLMRPAVFLHVATIAIWAGALLPLLAEFRKGGEAAGAALHRFSVFIPCAVLVLAVAGCVLAVVQVRTPAGLITTAYGIVFLVKLGLLVLLFALAAINRWKLTSRSEKGEPAAIRQLTRSVTAETVILLLIFAVAATWRFTPPPRTLITEVQRTAVVHLETSKAVADVRITPDRAGEVAISAAIAKSDRSPLDPQEVTVVLSNLGAEIEPIRRRAEKGKDGWTVPDIVLPVPGRWRLRLDVIISDFEITRMEGEIEIAP
ncbi:copper resistance CopC/CopD family protein [Neorhizobium galegae]|uniref:copper resistance CopC/CopD family protein n=1 Tax=Neorhizobium galegae TaxID=399 RepID=UPI000620EBA6|nr:copper resistance protein CopC [Neorhizobium galegae]CDZ29629.1 Putative copper export protein [Neorhizobium galegae bv. officinalis]KAA9388651.1 copper resistance protein CopC [Neorhizobium galegae]KAB1113956.1 copper resistance protein CopC [Neorhizobium galegae]MCM2501056.1 copper resistance protein CopC [Neorhizobium galegae]MCQ1770949.1 copper resistance protein CopC [Neorhizobium galegae]